MTAQEEYIARLRAEAKKAGQPLGPQAQASTRRPANYAELSPRRQWEVDDDLGILDWDGLWNT
jgi:hypothetical protein